jgi:plasmid stabilization system protein ParE
VPAHSRKLVINETAQVDYLELLEQSVLTWGRDQAAQYKGALDDAMERLLEFPGLGRPVPELFVDGHRMRVRHHLVYYTFSDDVVTIHRILHERRHVTPSLLAEPEE